MIKKVRELFEYRELLFNLVRRELKVKYRGSLLGFMWSFMNPILLVIVYSVVFALFLRIPPPVGHNGLTNFPAFLLCGLLSWNYLNNSLVTSVGSIVDSGNLIKKVYFPREIIPLSSVFANLINFGFELIVLFGFLLILGNNFLALIPLLLLIIAIETVFIMALSLLLSLSQVYFRDTKHLMGVALTFWFFACPIIYPYDFVTAAAQKLNAPWVTTLYKANPMASFTLSYQKVFYFIQLPNPIYFIYLLAVSLVAFLIAFKLFVKYEPYFAEEV